MLTLADKEGRGGLPNADITDKMGKIIKIYQTHQKCLIRKE